MTAVEWLEDEFTKTNYLSEDEFYMKFKQAKEMEREQIKDAWLNSLTKGDFNSADEYYNQTYKNTEQ
jgi:hypothetical protein